MTVFFPPRRTVCSGSASPVTTHHYSRNSTKTAVFRENWSLLSKTKAAWRKCGCDMCHVSVRIGPRRVVFNADSIVTVPGDDDLRIVRWMVPVNEDEMDGNPVTCQIETDFPTEFAKKLPVLLAGYYCAGKTNVVFRLYRGQGPKPILRYFDEFLSEGGGNVTAWRPEKSVGMWQTGSR